MPLFWKILKQTAVGLWEELLYIVLFNFIVYLPILVAPNLIFMGWSGYPLLLPLGVLCLLALPPALFGLFHTTDQISKGNAIKFATFFDGARQSLKPAYIWGGINLVVIVLFVANIVFYFRVQASWGSMVSMFLFGVAVVWGVIQLLALSLYPRLITPGFKLAQKNALALAGMQPMLLLAIIVLTAVIIFLGIIVPLVMALLTISLVALLFSITTSELLKWAEKKDKEN